MASTLSATVKGGLFEQFGNTLTGVQLQSAVTRLAAQRLTRNKKLQELGTTLNGVVAGSAASASHSRVEANAEQGGKRTVETVYDVNRVTVAGDVTELDASLFTYTTRVASPPRNGDRNPLNNAGEA